MIQSSFAQSWELGLFGGGAGYMGDLNPVNPVKLSGPALGGQVKRNFDGYWSLKLGIMAGKIAAADSLSGNDQFRLRNLSFHSPITEVSLQTEFNFFDYVPSFSRRWFSPYLFAGVGVVFFNPKTEYQGTTYELNRYGTEGQQIYASYKKYALAVPYGAGVKFNIKSTWNLIAEVGYRTAYTDYLDDVSKRYPDPILLDNELSFALSDRSGEVVEGSRNPTGVQRGDLRSRDSYMFMGISLTYSIFSGKCPVVN
jgi:hypothetical protein